MERERKFRFIGDPEDYERRVWTGVEYNEDHEIGGDYDPITVLFENFPKDWEEVTKPEVDPSYFELDPPTLSRIPNQDQPASSMTKFEKCVIEIIGNIYSNINIKTQTHTYQEISQIAINQAKETFKQLDELK